jgi:uncharacterized YigZ family protein
MKPSPLSEQSETYFVPVEWSAGNLREKASRFLSFMYPVLSLSDANSIRKDLSKKYHDAAHQPYAARIGCGGKIAEKWSDDGEPTHTAGEPILKALKEAGVTNSLIVVVRYFGGTKLGTAGLIKAFHGSAAAAISNSSLKECYPTICLEAWLPFSAQGQFRHILSKFRGSPVNEIREEQYHAVLEIPLNCKEHFEKALNELREKWTSTLRWKWK